jgi:hypothetical protein
MLVDKQWPEIYAEKKFIMVNGNYEKVWSTFDKKGLCYP